MERKHYIIGDVHGHSDTLLKLIAKLPEDAKLVFVGDLIDRGSQSAKVIQFVKENSHLCVLGNHEDYMIRESEQILQAFDDKGQRFNTESLWQYAGGIQTLLSYDLIRAIDKKIVKNSNPDEAIRHFKNDVEWLKSLPLYLELGAIAKVSDKPVVVSHACIGDIWRQREDKELLREFSLWNRTIPSFSIPIFNIYGHTPVKNVRIRENEFVNVDTGCYTDLDGFMKLSAYCIESGEVVSVQREKQ